MSKVLIVEARFYDDMADALAEGAAAVLDAAGVAYERVAVPGVLKCRLRLNMPPKPAPMMAILRWAWSFVARPHIMILSAMKAPAA